MHFQKAVTPHGELERRKRLLADQEKRGAELRRAYEFSVKHGAVEKFLHSISIADRRVVAQASNRSDKSSRVAMTQAEYQECVRQYDREQRRESIERAKQVRVYEVPGGKVNPR